MDFSLVNKEGNVLTQDDWDSKFEALSRPPEVPSSPYEPWGTLSERDTLIDPIAPRKR